MKLLITGASGYLGRRTARMLVERGVAPSDLILVTRTPEKLLPLAPAGATIRYGDFTDRASLRSAFAGTDRMFLINAAPDHLPKGTDRPAVHRDAIDAAREAGVGHVVFLSMIGAEKPGNPYYAVEPALKESGMKWTMLRTAGYADSLGRDAKRFFVPKVRIGSRDDGTRATAYASRDDFAAAAAAVLATDGHESKIYNLTGPAYGLKDVAQLLSELSGKTVALVQLEGEALRRDLLERGMAPYVVEIVLKSPGVFLADSAELRSDFPFLIGREARSLHEHFSAHRQELLTGSPPAGQEPIFT